MSNSMISLLIFVLSYVFFILFPAKRTVFAIGASLLIVLTGVLTWQEALVAVNWNVMGIFVGTLFVADIFLDSRMPAYIAESIVNRTKRISRAILALCVLTGILSMFIENVATVMIVAPIALSLAKKLKIDPRNMMIAIAITSNLQGAATLIGDPPSMLLGGFAKMNFWDFFFYKGRPGIFFAVQAGAAASFVVLYLLFRKHHQKTEKVSAEKILSLVPTFVLVALIAALAAASFFDKEFSYMAGMICMAFGAVSLAWDKFIHKHPVRATLRSLDWDTTFFLVGIFIIVGGLTRNGWIESAAVYLSDFVGGDIFLAYTILVFGSVLLSAFIDNVPYLAAMLPVAMGMADKLSIEPQLFLFGLLIGACLGGNITPIGASANIVVCGLLKKEGYEVSFREFVKIGLPYTVLATLAAYIFVWLVWA